MQLLKSEIDGAEAPHNSKGVPLISHIFVLRLGMSVP